MQIKNWIAGTQIEELLIGLYTIQDEPKWRHLVFEYCVYYQEVYYFDCLEEAFDLLKEEFEGGNMRELFGEEFRRIKKEVSYAMNEYCFSLMEIGTVVHRLLDKEPLSSVEIQQMLNHVWEAYSCNLDPSLFEKREENVLIQLINKHIKGLE